MRLFTQEQFETLLEQGKPSNHGRDWAPVARLFLAGTGCTWLVSEIVVNNYRLYGYGLSDYGRGDIEAGFIDLTLLELMSDPLQMHHVQRDKEFVPRFCMSVYQTAARLNGGLTDDYDCLQEALDYLSPVQPVTRPFTKALHLQP